MLGLPFPTFLAPLARVQPVFQRVDNSHSLPGFAPLGPQDSSGPSEAGLVSLSLLCPAVTQLIPYSSITALVASPNDSAVLSLHRASQYLLSVSPPSLSLPAHPPVYEF